MTDMERLQVGRAFKFQSDRSFSKKQYETWKKQPSFPTRRARWRKIYVALPSLIEKWTHEPSITDSHQVTKNPTNPTMAIRHEGGVWSQLTFHRCRLCCCPLGRIISHNSWTGFREEPCWCVAWFEDQDWHNQRKSSGARLPDIYLSKRSMVYKCHRNSYDYSWSINTVFLMNNNISHGPKACIFNLQSKQFGIDC